MNVFILVWIFSIGVHFLHVEALPVETDVGVDEDGPLEEVPLLRECPKTEMLQDCPSVCEDSVARCYYIGGNETELCKCDNVKEEIPFREEDYLCTEDHEDASNTYGLEEKELGNVERCKEECSSLSGNYGAKYCIRGREPLAGKFICVCHPNDGGSSSSLDEEISQESKNGHEDQKVKKPKPPGGYTQANSTNGVNGGQNQGAGGNNSLFSCSMCSSNPSIIQVSNPSVIIPQGAGK